MKSKSKFYRKYITYSVRILTCLYLVSLFISLLQVKKNYKNQNRYFQVEGIRLDFKKTNNYTLGGIPNKNNQPTGKSDNTDSNADIWLPTQLVPSTIGTLKYDKSNSTVNLHLNTNIDDNDNSDYLKDKIINPRIHGTVKKYGIQDPETYSKEDVISETKLFEGIKIKYAEGANQSMTIKLRKIDTKTYDLLFSPKPNHLKYNLEAYRNTGRDSIEFAYGEFINSNQNCNQVDLIFYNYKVLNRSNKNGSITLLFSDEKILSKKGKIDIIPGTQILVELMDRQGKDVFSILVWINVLFLLLFVIFVLNSSRDKKILSLLLTGPILALMSLFNFSAILLSHYLFLFDFSAYFYKYLASGFSIPIILAFLIFYNWETFNILLLGVLALIAIYTSNIFSSKFDLVFFTLPFIFLALFLSRITKLFSNLLKKGKGINFVPVLIILILVAFIFLFSTTENQRFLNFIPAHSFVRFSIVICYVIMGLISMNNKRTLSELFKLVLLFCFIVLISFFATADSGFILLSAFTFLLLIIFNPVIKVYAKFITIFLLIGLFVFGPHLIPKMKEYQYSRIELIKDNYEKDEKISISDKQSTDKHRLMLHDAFHKHKWGRWSTFNIPKSFKHVIWSDYIFLFALVYFGGYTTLLVGMLLLILLIINLTFVATLNYKNKRVNDSKGPNNGLYLSPFVTASAFILFSYISQYLYMIGSIFRVFPLTGQSMPFLSFSWMENILFSVFLILSYAFFHKSNEQKSKGYGDLLEKLEKSSSLPVIVILIIVTPIITFSWITKIPNIGFYNDSGNMEYVYMANTKKVNLYNKILTRATANSSDLFSFLKSMRYTNLIQICREEIGVEDEQNVQKKAKFIVQELSKLRHNRKAYLQSTITTFGSDSSQWSLIYPHFEIDHQNLSLFQKNLEKKVEKKLHPITLGNQNIRLTRRGNSEEYFITHNANSNNVNTLNGLTLSNNSPFSSEYLYGKNSKLIVRKINGEEKIFYCQADIFSNLPIDISDYSDINKYGLTIDEKIQAIIYSGLHAYCKEHNIKAGGIVVLENKTGKVKGLVSYPSMKPNLFEHEKKNFLIENFSSKKIHLNRDLMSVPLTGYGIGSTWKILQCATALQIDPSYKEREFQDDIYSKHKMSTHIPNSTNGYSANLLKDLLRNHSEQFYSIMASDYDITVTEALNYDVPSDFRLIPRETGVIGKQFTAEDNNIVKWTSLGQYHVRIPLITVTTNLARVITGKKIFPTLINNKTQPKFKELQNAENLSDLKVYLDNTTRIGTAKNLRRIGLDGNPVFTEDDIIYAKTGTGDAENQHSLLVFGNENYTYGFFLYNKPTENIHAKHLAANLIPYIKRLCPNYLMHKN